MEQFHQAIKPRELIAWRNARCVHQMTLTRVLDLKSTAVVCQFEKGNERLSQRLQARLLAFMRFADEIVKQGGDLPVDLNNLTVFGPRFRKWLKARDEDEILRCAERIRSRRNGSRAEGEPPEAGDLKPEEAEP